MLQEIKTTLLGENARTENGLVVERADTTNSDGSDNAPESAGAANAANVVDDTPSAPSVGGTDPFRPALDETEESNRDELSMDVVFTLLGDERRRYALAFLSTRTEPVSVNELVEQVAAWEDEKDPEQLSSREREQVYVSMCHSHLPKLADAGAISYDDERETVGRGDQFEQFAHFLCRDE